MAEKFYAVRSGAATGIFRTWAECEPLVHGVAGAEYKSFPTRAQAEAYLAGKAPVPGKRVLPKKKKPAAGEEAYPVPEGTLVAFVDGSYNAVTKRYGYGCVLLEAGKEPVTENGWGDRAEFRSARNVAGELAGTVQALRYAWENGFTQVKICHDYSGIAAWYQGTWKANSPVAKEYVQAAEFFRTRLQATFEKIAAHTGVTYNEMADRLAKQAVGIGEKDD